MHFDVIRNGTDLYIWNKSTEIHFIIDFFYQLIMIWKPGTGSHFLITANSL